MANSTTKTPKIDKNTPFVFPGWPEVRCYLVDVFENKEHLYTTDAFLKPQDAALYECVRRGLSGMPAYFGITASYAESRSDDTKRQKIAGWLLQNKRPARMGRPPILTEVTPVMRKTKKETRYVCHPRTDIYSEFTTLCKTGRICNNRATQQVVKYSYLPVDVYRNGEYVYTTRLYKTPLKAAQGYAAYKNLDIRNIKELKITAENSQK